MSRNSVYTLITSVSILIVIGIIMLFSTSAYAQDSRGDIYFFLKRQSVWLIFGVVACIGAALLDYHSWGKMCWLIFTIVVFFLALCFVPGIGMRINGSWRWIHFGGFSFQPSELAKLATVICLARWFSDYEKQHSKLLMGFLIPMMIPGILMLLIIREEDLGTTLLLGAILITMMFVAGSRLLYMSGLATAIVGGILLLAAHMGNRMARMTAFLDLAKYKESFGLQQWEGLKAFASGGPWGLGLGNSREKMHYLPYAHTDFIFPIIGEELGLRVTLLVLFAFLLLALSGILIARQAKDRFGQLLALGLTMTIVFQAMVNIGVTTALLPNKGMPLPFISAGGSNLCLCLLFIGILINIHRQTLFVKDKATLETAKLKARSTPRL